ncbi:sporulation protein YqfD [Cytobacillus sp. Hz8]|uniref:sporulation protein YqfD n=1 Tax=Cytobacillus sp. Hz8 TaxID=3347168 RepID=UPI0035DE8840
MKNQWILFFSGIVAVKVSGNGIERLINKCIRSGIYIWNVKRHGTHAVTLKIGLQDVHKLRHAARDSDCKIEFLRRSGVPFLLKRLMKNGGFLAGAILFLFIIFILSNMVWGIEIKGANPATEYKIRKELDKMGVKVGQLQFFINNVEGIQSELTNQIDEITWVGVELKGTTYSLKVVEKNEPKKPKQVDRQNLVAKKKAVIVDMFVEEGQPMVEVNQHVKKGQLLVSGVIGKEGETKEVPAKGKVYGETWYKTEVELPLETTFQVFNGKEKRKHYLKLGKWQVPIWGFGKLEFNQYETEVNEKKVRFLKWQIPISYTEKTFREREKVERSYSKKEAVNIAKEMARKDIKSHLSEDAIIKGENVLQQSFENGKVKLSIHFQIIENIAVGQPIIQGDSE